MQLCKRESLIWMRCSVFGAKFRFRRKLIIRVILWESEESVSPYMPKKPPNSQTAY